MSKFRNFDQKSILDGEKTEYGGVAGLANKIKLCNISILKNIIRKQVYCIAELSYFS